jgi:CysZ protein
MPGRDLATGAHALLDGARTIVRERDLWPYVLAPLLISALIMAVAIWLALGWVGGYLDARLAGWQGGIWAAGASVIRFLAPIATVLIVAVATKVAVLPAAIAPFREVISEMVEAKVTGVPVPERPAGAALRDFLPAIGRGLATSAYGIIVLVVFLPVLLIPGVGVILYLAPTAYIEALGALDATFGRKGMGLEEKRAWMRRRRVRVAGFGGAILAANLIPLGALLIVPAAAAGGALLVVRDTDRS